MKVYTFNPLDRTYKTASKFREYIQETELSINSLVVYKNYINPNYLILNKNYGSNKDNYVQPISLEDLIKEGVIKLVAEATDYDKSTEGTTTKVRAVKLYLMICPNRLKFHQGIVNQYGDSTIIYYDDSFNTFYNSITDHSTAIQTLMSKELESWCMQNLKKNNIFSWTAPIGTQGVIPVYTRPATAQNMEQGHVVFCNVTDDGLQPNTHSNLRMSQSSYKILPLSGACGYFVPTTESSSEYWKWMYIANATDTVGTSCYINLKNIPSRFYYRGSTGKYGYYNLASSSSNFNIYLFDSTSSSAPSIGDMNIVAHNQTLWTGFENNVLINEYVLTTDSSEEEIFLDDEINYGTLNVANTSDPYYNITIKHEINFPFNNLKTKIW